MKIQQISAAITDINNTISHLERSDSSDPRIRNIRIILRDLYSDLNTIRREEGVSRRSTQLQKEIKRDSLRPVIRKGGE